MFKALPASDGMMGGVLVVGGVGVGQVGGHARQGLQGGVGGPYRPPPVGVLVTKQCVG